MDKPVLIVEITKYNSPNARMDRIRIHFQSYIIIALWVLCVLFGFHSSIDTTKNNTASAILSVVLKKIMQELYRISPNDVQKY